MNADNPPYTPRESPEADFEFIDDAARRHFSNLSRYVMRITNGRINPQDSEEMAHNALCALFKKAKLGWRPQSTEKWLFNRVWYLTLNHLATLAKRDAMDVSLDEVKCRNGEAEGIAFHEQVPDKGATSPDKVIVLGERLAEIKMAIRRLPEAERLVWETYIENYPIGRQELTELVKLATKGKATETSVKAAKQRGQEKLQKWLQKIYEKER